MRFTELLQRVVVSASLAAQAFVPFAMRFPAAAYATVQQRAYEMAFSRFSGMGAAGFASMMSPAVYAQATSIPDSGSSSSSSSSSTPEPYQSSPADPNAKKGQDAGWELLKQGAEMMQSDTSTGAVTATPKDADGNPTGDSFSVTPEDIFGVQPTQEQTQHLQNYYEKDGELRRGALENEETMKSDTSPDGQAAATMRMGVDRPHPNLSNDPIIRSSTDLLKRSSEITRDFADCRDVVVQDGVETVESHIADNKVCERAYIPSGTHTLYHDYDVKPLLRFGNSDGWFYDYNGSVKQSTGFHQPTFHFEACGEGCLDVFIGVVGNDYWNRDCDVYEQMVVLDVMRPEVLQSAKIERVRWGNEVQLIANDRVVYGPAAIAPESGMGCPSPGDHEAAPFTDMKSAFAAGPVTLRLKASAMSQEFEGNCKYGFDGGHDCDHWTVGSEAFAQIRFLFDPKSLVDDRGWYPEEAVKAARNAGDGQCADSVVTVENGPTLDADGCAVVSGIKVCPQHFDSVPSPAVSPLARQARIEVHCNFLYGTSCYTDRNGKEQCYTTTEENTSDQQCQQYESDPGCAFITTRCIEGAQGDSGECYLYENVFDCGETVSTQRPIYSHRTECVGAIRCMSEECVTPDHKKSVGITKAAAVLSAANMIAGDAVCDDQGHCEVFKSEMKRCKKVWHGTADCCIDPGPVSMTMYLELMFSVMKIQDGVDFMSVVPGEFGTWLRLAQGGTSLYSAVEKGYMSLMDSITGATTSSVAEVTGEAVAETAAETFMNEILQALMKKAAEAIYEMFGADVANLIFQASGGGAAVTTGGTVATELSLSSAVTSAISVIGWIYLIYCIVTILVQIIWECEDDEFTLAVDRALKKCVYLGQYCSRYFGGGSNEVDKNQGCWVRKQTSCCFNTPFARIVMEQVGPQLGYSFGTAEHPSCFGLPVQQMDDVDWSRVDLSEWIAILTLSGKMPDPNDVLLNMESLTGVGSDYDTGNRQNSAERATERVTDIDPDSQRESVREQGYEDAHDGSP